MQCEMWKVGTDVNKYLSDYCLVKVLVILRTT